MKVRYVKTEMNEIEIVSCQLFATSTLGINVHSQGEFEEDFSNGRRGTWGNLWEENE